MVLGKLDQADVYNSSDPQRLEIRSIGLAIVCTINLERRDDGGLRVEGPRPGSLILSGPDPEAVLAKIWPALIAINHPITKEPK